MWYDIPVSKIETLKKIIDRVNKKGAAIDFELGDKGTKKGTLTIIDSRGKYHDEPIDVEYYEVFVDGSYGISGWRFVGIIEFTENGNIIRLADSSFEGKIPDKYRHTPKVCEHCGKIRNRKDTYLIYNEKTDEFKQVGSSCLLEYTRVLNADRCAEMMSCFDKILELSNFNCSEDEFFGDCFNSTGYSMSRDIVLPIAYAYVKQYGYERMYQGKGTAADIMIMIQRGSGNEEMANRYESLVLPTKEELEAVNEFAQQHKDDENQYMSNASLAWLNKSLEFRDFSLIASFVNTYLKTIEKQKIEQERRAGINNEYIGTIGEKITFKVSSARVLYTKDPYVYYGAPTLVYQLTDEQGHVIIWSTQYYGIKEGDVITATIKAQQEYKGIKQTVITRGKIQ